MSASLARPTAGDFYIFRFDGSVYTLESDVTGVIGYFKTAAEVEAKGRLLAEAERVNLWRANNSGALTLVASFRPLDAPSKH